MAEGLSTFRLSSPEADTTTTTTDNNAMKGDQEFKTQSDYDELKTSFHDYIAKSKEYELEMDDELAALQEELNQSFFVNEDLVSQLEKIGPQMMKLELANEDFGKKLEEETSLRRQAEQSQEVAQDRVRELQEEVRTLKEENDRVTEELAFKEEEMEERVLEIEIEKEQLREELEDLKADIIATDHAAANAAAHVIQSEEEEREREEEKEELQRKIQDVTEKLMETEAKLSTSQNELSEAQATVNTFLEALKNRKEELQQEQDVQVQLQDCENEIFEQRSLEESQMDETRPDDDDDTKNNSNDEELCLLRSELEQVKNELQMSREEVSSLREENNAARVVNWKKMEEIHAQYHGEISMLREQLAKHTEQFKSSSSCNAIPNDYDDDSTNNITSLINAEPLPSISSSLSPSNSHQELSQHPERPQQQRQERQQERQRISLFRKFFNSRVRMNKSGNKRQRTNSTYW